jgi:hypothetical protein
MDHELRCLIAELCAAKSSKELERVLDILRARGDAALRETAMVLADTYLSLRLQRAAIALAVEVGGVERARLLRALLTRYNVDDEEQGAAVRALGADTSSETLAVLLELLAVEGRWGGGWRDESECGRAVVAHLVRVPADFDWAPLIGNVASSRLDGLREALGAPAPELTALAAAVDDARRTRCAAPRGAPRPLTEREARLHDEAIAAEVTEHGTLLPPWRMFPGVHPFDAFWRMGGGDWFVDLYGTWMRRHSPEAWLDYLRAHAPIPVEWVEWAADYFEPHDEPWEYGERVALLAEAGLADLEAYRAWLAGTGDGGAAD